MLFLVFLCALIVIPVFGSDLQTVTAERLLAVGQGSEEREGLLRALDSNRRFDGSGRTLLHEAAEKGNYDLVRCLLMHGAKIDVCCSRTSADRVVTPLHLAARRGHYQVCWLLLTRGASALAETSRGYTPLHEAALGGHAAVCSLLVHYARNVNSVSIYRFTPLMLATIKGHTEVMRVLLRHQARVDQMENGNTALSLAIEAQHLDSCRLLLEHGASLNINLGVDSMRWGCYKTPRTLAAGFPAILALIKQHEETVKVTGKI